VIKQTDPGCSTSVDVVEQRYQAVREVLDGASVRSPKKEALPLPVKSCYALG